MDDELLTSSQAAALRGTTQTTINRAVADGRLTPAYVVPGNLGARLFRRDDVLELRLGRPRHRRRPGEVDERAAS